MDITINEVKEVFNSYAVNIPNGRTAIDYLGIEWESAVFKNIYIGNAIVFSINNIENKFVGGSELSQRYAIESTSFAFAYKYNGKVVLELVQPVPSNNDILFTGHVLIREWNGEVKRILFYKQGKFNGEMEYESGASAGRLNDVECVTTYYWDCVEVSVDGYGTYVNCESAGSSTTCYPSGPTPVNPNEYFDAGPSAGGGGSGSSGSGDSHLCTNPFDPTLYVPCNDITCGEGFVFDEEDGKCVLEATQIWEDEITLSEEFENDPCAMAVYNALKENSIAWNLLSGFFDSNPENLNLDFDLNPDLPNNIGATTNKLFNGNYLIMMNSSLFESYPFISIARVMLHEFIHAELFYRSNSSNSDFASLFNQYASSEYGTTHHNIMVNNYINLMSDVLYDLDNGYRSLDHYKALAFIGLTETDYYVNNIAGTIQEEIIIAQQMQVLNYRRSCK